VQKRTVSKEMSDLWKTTGGKTEGQKGRKGKRINQKTVFTS